MSKLEDGYIYGDSNGNVRFVSYDSLGGGGVFFALIILATIFLEKLGNLLIGNQWIVLIPTLIAVVIRYLTYDEGLSAKQKVCNVVSDALRTLGIYGVLIALFAKVLSCHVLDRIFVALGLGLLFAAAYTIINMVCKFFRTRQWYVAHLLISIASAFVSLIIYLGQVTNVDIELFNSSTILDLSQSDSFPLLIIILSIIIGVTIRKKINRETQAKFNSIGNELKKYLPCDADEYYVNSDGISYVDKQDERYYLSYEQLGYASFPVENETVTMRYINGMGKWLLNNIVSDSTRYMIETSREGLGYCRLRTHEYINKHTLKKW